MLVNLQIEAAAIADIAAALAGLDNPAAHKALRRLQAQLPETNPAGCLLSKLTRPLIVFDLETTAKEADKARIIEIGYTKIYPDGETEIDSLYLNPGMPIPEEAIAVHGITDETVAGMPTFEDVKHQLLNIFSFCDLAGYNSNHFDIAVLAEEFNRVNISFPAPDVLLIDAFVIFRKNEERRLADAYRFYTGNTLEDAHQAAADVNATVEILEQQMCLYPELAAMSLEELHNYCKKHPNQADIAGKLIYNDAGELCYNFGKWQGKAVTDPATSGYSEWVLTSDFPATTKALIRAEIAKKGY